MRSGCSAGVTSDGALDHAVANCVPFSPGLFAKVDLAGAVVSLSPMFDRLCDLGALCVSTSSLLGVLTELGTTTSCGRRSLPNEMRGRIWRVTMRSIHFGERRGAVVALPPLQNTNEPTDARRVLECLLGNGPSTARTG